jgi:hypothetical protein
MAGDPAEAMRQRAQTARRGRFGGHAALPMRPNAPYSHLLDLRRYPGIVCIQVATLGIPAQFAYTTTYRVRLGRSYADVMTSQNTTPRLEEDRHG